MKTKIKRFISGIDIIFSSSSYPYFGNSTAVNISISAVAIIAINEYFNSLSKKYNVERWIGNILAILLAFIRFFQRKC